MTHVQRDRVIRFQVSSSEELARISAEPLPLGLREVSTDLDFFRVVYFDTSTADLQRKGATVRLRIRPDDMQSLLVDIGAANHDRSTTRRHAEADVQPLPPADLFAGPSEPAQMLRALVDPSLLRPALEIETVRRVRNGELDGHQVSFSFDAITIRRGELSGEMHELEISIDSDAPIHEGLVEAVESAYGVRLIMADTIARARGLLDHMTLERLESDVRAAREVAVVAYTQGRIALCRDGESLHVPVGHGSGQEACRRVLRGVFGRAHARIRLLGTSAGVEARPGLEVWLAEGVEGDERECAWLPLDVVLEHVGSSQLREPRTLAALHIAARSGLAVHGDASPNGGAAEWGGAYSIFQSAVSAARMPTLIETIRSRDVPHELLLNPELSRLGFDERILVIAEDERTPLLERVRFLSMFGTRLDDFFMTRIAEFKDQVAEGITDISLDGLTPAMQHDMTRVRARRMLKRAYDLLSKRLLPELEAQNIRIRRWNDLTEQDRAALSESYERQVDSVLTPVIADPTHPFPHMRNLRPAIAAVVRMPGSLDQHFVAMELPGGMPRFIPLPGSRDFVPLEELILGWLPNLYPGVEIVQASTFRVTRSAIMEFDDEPPGGVLAAVEEKIARRPFGEVVRLEVESTMPEALRDRLLRELQFEMPEIVTRLSQEDVYPADRFVDLAALRELAALEVPELHFEPFEQATPLDERSVFEQVAEGDVMMKFPYDSFEQTVERFFDEAADDPDVVAMKITLYRTDANSQLVQALARARSAGKDAFALVELKASFDERRNIEWARSLQNAGIHVVFSPAAIKVHAKIALVVRREGDVLRRYVYIGTGNLNAATARAYTDVGILTAHPELTEEVNDVFNILTGYSASEKFQQLLVSPFTMRDRFMQMVEREIEHAREGRGGRIRIQMNGLADRRMIAALYRAAHEGVRIDMMVREICCMRPGLEGISDNVRIVSVLGRFLQHQRIYCFHNAGSPEYFIGSADWRPRNLSKRVEVITPVLDPKLAGRLDTILDEILNHPEAWELQPDGSYIRGAQAIAAK